MKEKALELADFLEKNMVASVAILGDVTATHIVSTIRRLVAELDKQWHMVNKDGYVKPLSEETIEKLREYHGINDWMYETSIVDFVRAVEKAHGIQ